MHLHTILFLFFRSSEDHNGGKRIRRPFQGRVSPTEEDKLLLKEISKPSRISYVSEKRRNPFLAAEDDTHNPFLDPDNEAENPFLAPDDKLALTGHQGAHRAGSAGHEENPESRSPGGTGDNKQLLEPTQPVDDPGMYICNP